MIRFYCLLVVLFAFAHCPATAKATSFPSKEKEILDSIFAPDKYDSRIRPNGVNETGAPVVAHVNLYVRNIESISDVNMEYTLQIILRAKWNDNRLTYDSTEGIQYLTLTNTGLLWMPDLFFPNERRSHFHNVISPNLFIRIFPDGSVLYSVRITLTMSCPMNLVYFPHDSQLCELRIASYSRTMNDLALLWQNENPVQMSSSIHLPRFNLESFNTGYCNSKTVTGEYSCIRMGLTFRRESQYYLLQYYIPCCMLVIASWISFWLDTFATTARVALGITTLLTMSLKVSSLYLELSPVSYTKAIDVWTGVCITFVFGALLEFAAVNFLSTRESRCHKRSEEQKNQIEMEQQTKEAQERASGVETKASTGSSKKELITKWFTNYPSWGKKIDVISRIAFPIAFAIFNLAYWCTYI